MRRVQLQRRHHLVLARLRRGGPLQRLGHIDGDIAKALPTVVGLAAIPFIVKPIDGTIDTAMEMSVSKALNGKIEGPADAGIALGVIGACLVVPPTLFSVAAAIKDVAA